MKFKRIITSNFTPTTTTTNFPFTLDLSSKEIIKNVKVTVGAYNTDPTKNLTGINLLVNLFPGSDNVNFEYLTYQFQNVPEFFNSCNMYKDAYFDAYIKNSRASQKITLNIGALITGLQSTDTNLSVNATVWFYIWEL